MRSCWSSASYWPQTKVTLLVKNISLVLVLGLFLGLDIEEVHSSPVQVHRNTQQLHYCDYRSAGKVYSIVDLLKCLNELASLQHGKRNERSIDDKIHFFPTPSQPKQYLKHYFPYSQSSNYYPAKNSHRGPSYPANNPGYYKYPPALPPGYPLTSDSSSTPGILGINLVDALSSISHYDDLKCVPRIICEVAAGVIPGNSVYKQNNANTGMNALISFLTAINTGDTSPLLDFGKSALMGYANRGNSEICYRQYPKCPRNPNQVVNYLNNHNGGFFRFFNRDSGDGYRVEVNNKAITQSQNSASDRRGTGELKFDTVTITRAKTLNYDDKKDESKVVFPDEQRHSNRLTRSYDYEYGGHGDLQERPTYLSRDRMDQITAGQLFYLGQSQSPNEQQNSYNKSRTSEAKLYLLDNISNENHKPFVFPDGQSVMINIGFSKLFNEGYKKMLKRGLIMNAIPQPINFEGLSMINLPELYTQDDTQQYIQVIHPCDMICHDSRGAAVQFNQIVDSRGILSTIMIPERPILDLSQPLPCEIICLTRDDERQQLSTTLDRVFRANHQMRYEVNRMTNRFKRVPSSRKIIKPRFIGDTYMRTLPKSSHDAVPHQPRQMTQPVIPPIAFPIRSGAGGLTGPFTNGNSRQGAFPFGDISHSIPIASYDEGSSLDGVVMGENPLASAITVEPQPEDLPSFSGDAQAIPATIIMCDGFVYFIPVSDQAMPMCGASIETTPDSKPDQILYQPRNRWGNYTNFLAHFANFTYHGDVENATYPPEEIKETTAVTSSYTPATTIKPVVKPILPIPPTKLPSTPSQSESFGLNIPDGFDYQQATSCLEGEWDTIDHQCVPIAYHKDADYDYSDNPGYNWEKIPVKKRDDQIQKIIIMTPNADMLIKSM